MISLTELDRRVADHGALVARINREGWKRETAVNRGSRGGGVATVVGRTRGRVGLVLIRAGAWLQGAPARRAVDSATAG